MQWIYTTSSPPKLPASVKFSLSPTRTTVTSSKISVVPLILPLLAHPMMEQVLCYCEFTSMPISLRKKHSHTNHYFPFASLQFSPSTPFPSLIPPSSTSLPPLNSSLYHPLSVSTRHKYNHNHSQTSNHNLSPPSL